MQRYELGLVLFSPSSSSLPEKKKKKRNKLLLPGSVLVFSKVECPKASFQEKDMRQTISLQFVHESENGSLLYESQLSES